MTSRQHVALRGLLCGALIVAATSCRSPQASHIEPVYDKLTGKLQLLKYDSNGNGKVDTWSYMDGARVVRIEIDNDEDGQIERWEYYNAAQQLEKVGVSLGRIMRVEQYENDVLVRAEEDSDEDSKPDKWETYEGGRLTSVAFDTIHRGTPDRRLIYGGDGSARLEVDAAGDGHFLAAQAPITLTASSDAQ